MLYYYIMFLRLKSLHIIKRFSHTHTKTTFPNCSTRPDSVNFNENNKPKNEIDKKIDNIQFEIDRTKSDIETIKTKMIFITMFNVWTMVFYYF